MWWQLLLLQAGFFLLLIWALQRFFHGHLLAGISRIEKLQAQNLKKEEELKRMQETVLERAEKRLKELDVEVSSKRAAAEQEILSLKRAAQAALEEEKKRMAVEAREKEKLLSERLQREFASRAAAHALEVIREAFSPKMLEKVHVELSDELLESLASADEGKVRLNGKTVKVRSAYALSAKQKEILKGRIARVTGSTAEWTEETDASLAAGFIVYLGETVWDGSLQNKLQRLVKERS